MEKKLSNLDNMVLSKNSLYFQMEIIPNKGVKQYEKFSR
jgi:hypothetical protein